MLNSFTMISNNAKQFPYDHSNKQFHYVKQIHYDQ